MCVTFRYDIPESCCCLINNNLGLFSDYTALLILVIDKKHSHRIVLVTA